MVTFINPTRPFAPLRVTGDIEIDGFDGRSRITGLPPAIIDITAAAAAAKIPPGMGADGQDGADGIPGQPGPQGVQGLQGVPGFPGQDGSDGYDGIPGAQGAQGVAGVAGPPGFPGQDGSDGYDGIPGAIGPQGIQGLQGLPGMMGIPGSDGADGYDGIPGAPGPLVLLPPRSVFANAGNTTAYPSGLAGSAAFQHLRVNSANNALEWSVLTTGDFPANSVPLTALPTMGPGVLLGVRGDVSATTPTAQNVNVPLSVNASGVVLLYGNGSGNLALDTDGSNLRFLKSVDSCTLWDDFFGMAGNISTPSGGFTFYQTTEGNWYINALTGAVAATATGNSGHPGQLTLTTGSTSGNRGQLELTHTDTLHSHDFEFIESNFSMSATTTSEYFFGWQSNTTANHYGYFHALNGTLTSESDNGSGTKQSTTITGVTLTSSNTYRIEYDGTSLLFYLNGTLKATHSTKVPNAVGQVFWYFATSAAATRSITVDYFALGGRNLFR